MKFRCDPEKSDWNLGKRMHKLAGSCLKQAKCYDSRWEIERMLIITQSPTFYLQQTF